MVFLEIHTKHHHYAHNDDITPLPDTPIYIYILQALPVAEAITTYTPIYNPDVSVVVVDLCE